MGGVWEGVSYVVGVEVCGRCDGRVRCVGVVKVCGTVLEIGQKGGICNVSSCTTLKRLRCMVGGVEECGGRGGEVW